MYNFQIAIIIELEITKSGKAFSSDEAAVLAVRDHEQNREVYFTQTHILMHTQHCIHM